MGGIVGKRSDCGVKDVKLVFRTDWIGNDLVTNFSIFDDGFKQSWSVGKGFRGELDGVDKRELGEQMSKQLELNWEVDLLISGK